MARYAGSAVEVTFGGATVSGYFTSTEWGDEAGVIDATAGTDTHEYTLLDVMSGRVTMTALHDSGTAGSAVYTALVPAASGTLVIHPTGTAANQSHHTWTSAKVISRRVSVARGDRAELNVEWATDVVEATTYT